MKQHTIGLELYPLLKKIVTDIGLFTCEYRNGKAITFIHKKELYCYSVKAYDDESYLLNIAKFHDRHNDFLFYGDLFVSQEDYDLFLNRQVQLTSFSKEKIGEFRNNLIKYQLLS